MRSWMIGTIMGIAPVSVFSTLPPAQFAGLLLVISVLIFIFTRCSLARWASGLCLGAALGMLHGHCIVERRIASECEQTELTITGIVASLPVLSLGSYGKPRHRFSFKVESIVPMSCAGPQKLLMSYYSDEPSVIAAGARLRFTGKLKRPWGLANPGGFNAQSWYAQEGIDGVGTVVPSSLVSVGDSPVLRYFNHEVRARVSARLASVGLSPDSLGILRAVTVADSSGIDDSLWKLFQVFGVNHLLVISGLHIGLVAALGFWLGSLLSRLLCYCGLQRWVLFFPQIAAAIFAGLYASLAGFSLPTNRAFMMLCVFLVATVCARRSSPWSNLLIAAFLVLVCNPLQALGSGFWLSFGAVGWLLWLNMWKPSRGVPQQLCYVHLGMSLFMVPLGGFWFGGASAISAAANFLMIPLVGFFVVPLGLLAGAVHGANDTLGDALFRLAAMPLDLLIPCARALVEQRGESLYYPFYPQLSSVLLAILGLCVMVARPIPRSHWFGLILCLPILLPARAKQLDDQQLALLTVLDVGQGTAIVFRDSHRTLIYDTGGGNPSGKNMALSSVIPYLEKANIRQLDTLIISHADNDHSAGAQDLLSTYPVDRHFSGATEIKPAVKNQRRPRKCVAGKAWQWSSKIRFRFLSPAAEIGLSSNSGSCVLQVIAGETRILLTGDIDRHREKTLVQYWKEQLNSHWMLSPHHGSNSSSSWLWLKYVEPASVVFTSGYRNRFGHPHPAVIQRVKNGNTTLYSTAVDGAVEFSIGTAKINAVSRHRRDSARYWH